MFCVLEFYSLALHIAILEATSPGHVKYLINILSLSSGSMIQSLNICEPQGIEVRAMII